MLMLCLSSFCRHGLLPWPFCSCSGRRSRRRRGRCRPGGRGRGGGQELHGLAPHVRHGMNQEGVRDRTEPAEPNRTKQFRNRPEPDAQTNRTEPDRATTHPKSAGRTASNRERHFSEPNRTKLTNFRKVRNRNESNRIGSFLINVVCMFSCACHAWWRNAKPAISHSPHTARAAKCTVGPRTHAAHTFETHAEMARAVSQLHAQPRSSYGKVPLSSCISEQECELAGFKRQGPPWRDVAGLCKHNSAA